MVRGMARMLAATACGMLCILLGGCAAGLTGGSIPPGERGTATGIVVRGDDATTILAGATIQFEPAASSRVNDTGGGSGSSGSGSGSSGSSSSGSSSSGSGSSTGTVPGLVSTTSDEYGKFSLTDIAVGLNTVTVTPPSSSGLAATSYSLQITAGGTYYCYLAPLPSTFSTVGFTGINVSPTAIATVVGKSVPIQVQLLGGAPPTVVPSYLVSGNIGVMDRSGDFVATTAGDGSLQVIVGPYTASMTVAVNPQPDLGRRRRR